MHHSKRAFLAPVFFLLLLVYSDGVYSQTPNAYFGEVEFEVEFPSESRWSYLLGLGSRRLFSTRLNGQRIEDARQEHIDIDQYTTYAATKNVGVSLGFRYRLKDIFDADEDDEFRIVEQMEIFHPNPFLNLEHRLRAEQRIERKNTEHRLRYAIGVSRSISEVFSLGFSPEFLYSMSSGSKPGMEYRLELGLENSSFKNLELELGLEYRREDFTNDPENEFFLITGITLDF